MTTGNELEQRLLEALTERQDELPTLPEAAAEAMRTGQIDGSIHIITR